MLNMINRNLIQLFIFFNPNLNLNLMNKIHAYIELSHKFFKKYIINKGKIIEFI